MNRLISVFILQALLFLAVFPIARADLFIVNHDDLSHDYVTSFDDVTGASLGFNVTLDFSTGLAIGSDHNLYVGNSNPGTVFSYNATTGAVVGNPFVSYNGTNQVPSNPQGMAFGPDGNLYVADVTQGNIYAFDSTGSLSATYTPSGGDVVSVAFFGTGLYAATSIGVEKYNPITTHFDLVVQSSSGGPNNVGDIAFGTDNKLYVLDISSPSIFVYNSDGTNGSVLVNSATFGDFEPTSMTFSSDNHLLVGGVDIDNSTGEVLRVDGINDINTFIAGLPGDPGPGFIRAGFIPEPADTALIIGSMSLLVLAAKRLKRSR